MQQKIKIIYRGQSSNNLKHFSALSQYYGIEVDFIDVYGSPDPIFAIKDAVSFGNRGVVLDVDSLKDAFSPGELEKIGALLREMGPTVLLLATSVGGSVDRFLRVLTGGVVWTVEHAGKASCVRFPVAKQKLSAELSSYTYPRPGTEAFGLLVDPEEQTDVIMTLDGSKSFVYVGVGRARVFVWSTVRIFDVYKPLASEKDFEEAVEEYVPVVIFLRFAFEEQCWHNAQLAAGLVIDDPLLRKNYGFIRFPKLLESARRHGYHVTVAFIPWNHWRCSAVDAQIFLDYQDCFSLCVHGCDHTENEFGAADYGKLLQKCYIATERMADLSKKTGLNIETIMVCPQELYSLEAMRAFADSRQFLGLSNTACIPRDLSVERYICGADLMLPAQDSFFGFSVFKRWYSHQKSLFALGVFLGKPAILVEHHDFFKDGLSNMENFVSELGKLRSDVTWKSIEQIASTTHLRKRISKNQYQIRFFTDRFQLEATNADPATYQFFRRFPDTTSIQRVEVNGNVLPFARDNGFLTFEVHANRRETVDIQLVVDVVRPADFTRSGIRYQVSVALRRILSEFRDNVLARNPASLKTATYFMRVMGQKNN